MLLDFREVPTVNYKIKGRRKMLLGAALALAAVALPTTAASATGAVVGGGNWNYGVQSGKVYSNYYHASKYHSATACNGALFDKCHAAYANAKIWANASNGSSPLGGNTAYWNKY